MRVFVVADHLTSQLLNTAVVADGHELTADITERSANNLQGPARDERLAEIAIETMVAIRGADAVLMKITGTWGHEITEMGIQMRMAISWGVPVFVVKTAALDDSLYTKIIGVEVFDDVPRALEAMRDFSLLLETA